MRPAGCRYLKVKVLYGPCKGNHADFLASDIFGADVCLYGDYVLIGAPEQDLNANGNEGVSYLYKRKGVLWNFVRKSVDDNAQMNEKFGTAVALHGNNLMHGIQNKNGNKGEVQFFNIE